MEMTRAAATTPSIHTHRRTMVSDRTILGQQQQRQGLFLAFSKCIQRSFPWRSLGEVHWPFEPCRWIKRPHRSILLNLDHKRCRIADNYHRYQFLLVNYQLAIVRAQRSPTSRSTTPRMKNWFSPVASLGRENYSTIKRHPRLRIRRPRTIRIRMITMKNSFP